MIKTIKDTKEMAYYLQAIDSKDLYFAAYWSKEKQVSTFDKMKIKSTHNNKRLLLIYYRSSVLKGTYLSAVADISNVEVYKPKKLHSSGEPTGNKKG